MSVDAIISADRALLERLGHFAGTPGYARLLATAVNHMEGDPEQWLAHWLMRPAFGLGGRPIDFVDEPGGIDMLDDQVVRIAHNCA